MASEPMVDPQTLRLCFSHSGFTHHILNLHLQFWLMAQVHPAFWPSHYHVTLVFLFGALEISIAVNYLIVMKISIGNCAHRYSPICTNCDAGMDKYKYSITGTGTLVVL